MELFYCKNYFNLRKIFDFRLFKMAANQTDRSSLEQRSVIKFLLAEKCKQSEIYRRIWDVYREVCLRRKKVYKFAEYGFATTSLSQSNSPWHGNRLTLLNKILGTAANKEGHVDKFLDHERTHPYWFPWKISHRKQCILFPTSGGQNLGSKIILLICVLLLFVYRYYIIKKKAKALFDSYWNCIMFSGLG